MTDVTPTTIAIPAEHPQQVRRADLVRFLDQLGIAEPERVASVRVELDTVYVDRYAYTLQGRQVTCYGSPVTITTRIGVR